MIRRIAMISEHASPVALLGGVDAGGQNVYVDAVGRGLARHGFTVDLFTVANDPSLPETIAWADGVRVVNVPIGAAGPLPKDALWPHMPAFRDAIARFAGRERAAYDLIHGNFWMSGWAAVELGLRWRVPVVQIFHATGVTKAREQGAADSSPEVRIDVERAIVRSADRLIAQCPAERDELLADYGARPDQIALIPSAVDVERYRPLARDAARRALGLDPSAEIVAYVGRIVPRKDVRNIVRALALLKARRLAAGIDRMPTLLVVGGETEHPDPAATPEIAVLRELAASLGVDGHVRFVGRKQPDALRRWYSAADVAVTTPWYEPFGLTPLEAMACAAPVIGSRVGGIAFTVVDGETGFLVPPRDPQSLCDRLDRLLGDSALRTRLGQAGRARVLREFTWPGAAARTAALYDEQLAAPTPLRSGPVPLAGYSAGRRPGELTA